MKELCNGCKTYIEFTLESSVCCAFISNYKNTRCPCSECLIKTMCDHACIKYDDYLEFLAANKQLKMSGLYWSVKKRGSQ